MFCPQHSAGSASPREILTAWIRLSSYGAPHRTPVRSRPGGPKDDSPRREPWVGVVCTESAPAGRQTPTTPESCTSPRGPPAETPGRRENPLQTTLPLRLRAPAGKSPPPPRAAGESQVSRFKSKGWGETPSSRAQSYESPSPDRVRVPPCGLSTSTSTNRARLET